MTRTPRSRRTGRTARFATGAAAVATSVGLALALTGCGGGAKPAAGGGTSAGAPSDPGAASGSGGGAPSGDSGTVLATIKGPDGIVLTLTSARRESGGFVTVSGTVRNTGDQPFTQAANWRGDEEALVKNGGSLAGASLVDLAAKKRYYVLRDTDGRCLCTTGLDIIQPGADIPVFAQFPAPPASTAQVDFEVPTLPSATIAISG
ncbi:hypothetical protein K7472_04250 [Streptomyces sp. PTM05]|uniref:Secreted protein n=1 Tax=Streptantibioticus parmotrematis TaxID=2873249 RepID=A0ABS7QNR4_9ACTN|nr:hypothetical protein [Streptantibioticus parmotrematis]MBY8884055.1 hypothetical protein [Streptantibioticus parmotrematis]